MYDTNIIYLLNVINNIRLKTFFLNFLLLIFSIYLPLFFISIFLEINSIKKQNKILKFSNSIKSEKINALKNSFLPFYIPNEIKKYGLENNVYPIGTLPNQKTYFCNEGYGLIKYKSDQFG